MHATCMRHNVLRTEQGTIQVHTFSKRWEVCHSLQVLLSIPQQDICWQTTPTAEVLSRQKAETIHNITISFIFESNNIHIRHQILAS